MSLIHTSNSRETHCFLTPLNHPSSNRTILASLRGMANIHRLPNEVLSMIFLYSLPSQYPTLRTGAVPIVLTRVCTRWRAVAIGTQKLWKGLELMPRQKLESFVLQPVRDAMALSVFAKRSGRMPLYIRLNYDGEFLDGEIYTIQKMIDMDSLHHQIFSVRDRILEFVVQVHRSIIQHSIISFARIPFRCMETLHIFGDVLFPLQSIIPPSNFPSLKDVSLTGPNLLMSTRIPQFFDLTPHHPAPSAVLNRLSLYESECTEWLVDNLRGGSILGVKELNLQFPAAVADEDDEDVDVEDFVTSLVIDTPGYVLPSTKSIIIDDRQPYGYHTAHFFQYAILPALESIHVHITNPIRHDLGSFPSIRHMLEKSHHPPLKSLTFTGLSMGPGQFLECLGLVSDSLEEIHADGRMFTEESVRALTWGSHLRMSDPSTSAITMTDSSTLDIISGSHLCPRLDSIEIDGMSPCSAGTAATMIFSRSQSPACNGRQPTSRSFGGPAPLQQVVIYAGCDLRNVPTYPEIKVLIDRADLMIYIDAVDPEL